MARWTPPAVAGGYIYIGSWDHNVYCFDSVTGAKIWNYATGGGVSSSPAIVDGRVYVGSWDHNAYAFSAHTLPATSFPAEIIYLGAAVIIVLVIIVTAIAFRKKGIKQSALTASISTGL